MPQLDKVKAIGYGVLVRHPGFIDRLLPSEGNSYYPVDNINHWVCSINHEPMCLRTEKEAEDLAKDLAGKFAGDKYRFTVAVCRLVPRWFISKPERDSEKVPIGRFEKIY